jgi:hypothetical protein
MYIPRAVTPRTLVLAVVVSAALAAGPRERSARAAGESEWQLSARTGVATVTVDQRTTWGFAAALDLEYGLTDSWALRATLATTLHSVDPAGPMDTRPAGKIETSSGLAGLTYTIDILRLVPYADLQVGAFDVRGAVTTPRLTFISALGLGADYFVTRQWTTGIYFQYLFAPIDLITGAFDLGGSSPYAFSITLRVSRIF